jgi:16S rRNA processing protein RimM
VSGETSALIELGQVGAAFGIRGWVKLHSYTEPPERLLEHCTLRLRQGDAWRDYAVEATGRSGGALTVKLAGVPDRTAAEALKGAVVAVPRSDLPACAAGDFYRADLLGCEVVNLAGDPLGVVAHFVETPAHALMVVRGTREYWVPAVPQHLRRVDLEARRIVVDWEEPAD